MFDRRLKGERWGRQWENNRHWVRSLVSYSMHFSWPMELDIIPPKPFSAENMNNHTPLTLIHKGTWYFWVLTSHHFKKTCSVLRQILGFEFWSSAWNFLLQKSDYNNRIKVTELMLQLYMSPINICMHDNFIISTAHIIHAGNMNY